MQTIVIVIHMLVVIALVGVVLMQRSEGGGLGIGGGSGFMSARGAANALTRATAILAALFFATSLFLSLLARYQGQPTDIFDTLPQGQTQQNGGGILDDLGGAPSTTTPDGEEQVPTPAGEEQAPAQTEEQANPESQVPTGQ